MHKSATSATLITFMQLGTRYVCRVIWKEAVCLNIPQITLMAWPRVHITLRSSVMKLIDPLPSNPCTAQDNL